MNCTLLLIYETPCQSPSYPYFLNDGNPSTSKLESLMQHAENVHFDVSVLRIIELLQVGGVWLLVGSSSITEVSRQIKVLLCAKAKAAPCLVMHTLHMRSKKARLKLMPPVLEATLPDATCAHIILTDEIFKWPLKTDFCAMKSTVRLPIGPIL